MADVRAQIEIELVDNVSARARAVAQAQLDVANATKVVAAAALEEARADAAAATSSKALAAAELKAARSAQQLARAELSVARAGQTMASRTQVAERATSRISDAQKRQGLAMAQNVNLVSELALGFGNLSPATRQLGITFATAGNNAFALAGIFGPMGVAIGTMIGVLPGLIGLFSDMGDEANDAANATDRARQSLLDLVQAQTSARQNIESEEALFSGEADASRIEDAINVVRQQRNSAAARERAIAARGGGAGRALSFEQRVFRSLQDSNEPVTLAAVNAAAERLRESEGRRTGLTPGSTGFVFQTLQELQRVRSSSTGTQGIDSRSQLLQRGLEVARAREQREALDDAASSSGQGVSLADAALQQALRDAGVSNRARSRLRESLDESTGGRIDLRGISNPAVREAATRAALARQRQRVIADQVQARDLEDLDATLSGGRTLDGLRDPTLVTGGAGGRARVDEVLRARSDAPSTSTVNLNVRTNGGSPQTVSFQLGDSVDYEADAEGPGELAGL